MNKNKCTIFILLNLATSYCNNFLYTNSNQYFPASKTKFALFRNQIKTIPCHVYIFHTNLKLQHFTLINIQSFFLLFLLFPLKFSDRQMTSRVEQKKKKISRIYRTWESLTGPRHHFHAEPILPTFIRIRCFVKYQFHPIIYIFPGRYASHFINSMESESVEFHRLQFRPPPFSSPRRRISPLTAVINFFPRRTKWIRLRGLITRTERVAPSFRQRGAWTNLVDDNKYKTLIILGITPTGIYARAISPFQKWRSSSVFDIHFFFFPLFYFSLFSFLPFFLSFFLSFSSDSRTNGWSRGEQRSRSVVEKDG